MLGIFSQPMARVVSISNTAPRVDQNGDTLDAHDGSLMRFNGTYYLYGTAYNNQNGTVYSNRFVVYSSPDLVNWTHHGDITSVVDSLWGMYFRPHVVYNALTRKYVLWYNWYPRGLGWTGQFGVATADKPWGPFTVQNANVSFPLGGSVGDFAILVDDDGTGWCAYGWHNGGVAQLSADYLSIQAGYSPIGNGEGFSMFKRNGIYYNMWGNLCCFCSAGSSADVARSTVATGPFTAVGNIIGANIHAQPLGTLKIETVTGAQYAYLGDRWQSAPDGVKGHDFIYISEPMLFADNGNISALAAFTNSFSVDLAAGVASPGPSVGRNLAKGKTATASSTYGAGGWGLNRVTDGRNFSLDNTSMGWTSSNSLTANHTEWVIVDLGAAFTFDQIILYPRVSTLAGVCPGGNPDDSWAGAGFPTAFTIETSPDNAAWNPLVTRTNYPAPYVAPQRFIVPATTARYVRITGTQLVQVAGEYRMQFAEIAVLAIPPVTTAMPSAKIQGEKPTSEFFDAAGRKTAVPKRKKYPTFPVGR